MVSCEDVKVQTCLFVVRKSTLQHTPVTILDVRWLTMAGRLASESSPVFLPSAVLDTDLRSGHIQDVQG